MNDADKILVRDAPGGAVLAVKVVPGSSRDKVVGALGDSLKIATSAAPEKGKANLAVAAILAKALGVDKRSVRLISGPTNPRKEFQIAGLTAQELTEKLRELTK